MATDEQFVSDEEYPSYFESLNGLRPRIVHDLPIRHNGRVLDLATGYGYFAIELARCDPSLRVEGIDISEKDISITSENVRSLGLADRVAAKRMDSTNMSFQDGYFDMAVNFLGLEDIHMTRGKAGVERTFYEVYRVLKPSGHFCFVAMPPEEMETVAQRLEVELFSHVCGATWLSMGEYGEMLDRAGFNVVGVRHYQTGKKLTPTQAREEIRFACDNVPKIYGVRTPSFEEVWARYGLKIEENGLGHYSRVLLVDTAKATHCGRMYDVQSDSQDA
jgi:cyclopropane fatty-acyl-phospholipid synthase-like methyltransferase